MILLRLVVMDPVVETVITAKLFSSSYFDVVPMEILITRFSAGVMIDGAAAVVADYFVVFEYHGHHIRSIL